MYVQGYNDAAGLSSVTYFNIIVNLTITISQYSSHIQRQQLQHVAQKYLCFNKVIGLPNENKVVQKQQTNKQNKTKQKHIVKDHQLKSVQKDEIGNEKSSTEHSSKTSISHAASTT